MCRQTASSVKTTDDSLELCRLCCGSDIAYIYSVAGCDMGTCPSCGLLQLISTPTKNEISAIYDDNYFERGKYVKDQAQVKEQERRMKLLREAGLPQGATVLDAGCATGGFIQHAKNFYNVWGIDISDHAINEAKKVNPEIKNQISVGTVEEQDFSDNFFDAVVLWDVVEHLTDPVAVLKELRKILKPEGKILLSTPNSGAITAKKMGKRWAFMTPPEHICLFDKITMTKLLESSGFQINQWKTRGKWVNLGFFLYKLAKKFPKLVPQSLVKFIQNSPCGSAIFYVPSGDIQYVTASKPTHR